MTAIIFVACTLIGSFALASAACARIARRQRGQCRHEGIKAVFVAQDGIYELCGACAGLKKISKETPIE